MLNNPGNFVSQTPNTSGSFNSSRGGRPQPKRGRGGMRGSPAATSSRSTSPEFKVPAVPTQVLPPSAGGYGPSPGYLPAQSPISGPSNAVSSPLTSIGPTAWAVPGTSSALAGPSYQPSGSTSHISGNSNAAGSNTSAITTSAGALAYLSAPGGPLTPTVAAAVQSRLQSLGTGGLPSHVAVPSQNDVEEEGDDEMLPAMAEDDYSAQASWQTQSKDNLRVLMQNLSDAQYDRFEAYRRHALPKQAVRKVIQQTVGQQVSMPVAQVVAGISKVFVGEIVEKARAVQQRRGDIGPLSPDHLREAYRSYQQEAGRVGAAKPIAGKKLFVR